MEGWTHPMHPSLARNTDQSAPHVSCTVLSAGRLMIISHLGRRHRLAMSHTISAIAISLRLAEVRLGACGGLGCGHAHEGVARCCAQPRADLVHAHGVGLSSAADQVNLQQQQQQGWCQTTKRNKNRIEATLCTGVWVRFMDCTTIILCR